MWDFLEKNKILNGLNDSSVNDVNAFYSDEKTKQIFGFIRDKFGFHYEYQNDVDKPILDALNTLDCFEAWLSTKDSGNEIFRSANSIVLLVIFEKMRGLGFEGDDNALMKILFELVLKGAKVFRNFTLFFITEGLPIKWKEETRVAINVPEISEIKLPLVVAGQK
jgi:hypothetical protein